MAYANGTYLLDVVVTRAEDLSPEYSSDAPIWLVFQADSLEQAFSTPKVPASNPTWDYPFRLVLNVPDINISYLFVTMCTYDRQRQIKPIARCRLQLGSMPSGNAKKIQFPMLMKGNRVCTMRFCATISQYSPQARTQPVSQMSEIGAQFGAVPLRPMLFTRRPG